MPKTIAQKLNIKENEVLLVVNKPTNFEQTLAEIPNNVSIINKGKNYTQIHWFVQNTTILHNGLHNILSLLKPNIICWVYYPKQTSKMATDLTRDKGWDELLKHDELKWISLISFNDIWSVFGFRLKTEKDIATETKPKEKPVLNYINATTKTVIVPNELAILFKKNKQANLFFNALSFTNKKEYVEWIVSAKKEETKANRLLTTIEKLNKGCKNPSSV